MIGEAICVGVSDRDWSLVAASRGVWGGVVLWWSVAPLSGGGMVVNEWRSDW